METTPKAARMNGPTILDPRFRYVPSLETDVAATWKRFGFSPKDNEERRAGLRARAVASGTRGLSVY